MNANRFRQRPRRPAPTALAGWGNVWDRLRQEKETLAAADLAGKQRGADVAPADDRNPTAGEPAKD